MTEIECPVCGSAMRIVSEYMPTGTTVDVYVMDCPDHGWFEVSYDNQDGTYTVNPMDGECQ